MAHLDDSLTPVQWRTRYARGPNEFDAALAGLTEADIDIAAAEGEWTIRAIVNHVAEVEVRATFMMTVAMGNSGTPLTFDWFPGTNKAWGRALAFEQRPVASALATIHQMRAYLLTLLDTIEDAGARHIVYSYAHPEMGWEPMPFTVDEMVQGYTVHIHEHIAEIGKIARCTVSDRPYRRERIDPWAHGATISSTMTWRAMFAGSSRMN